MEEYVGIEQAASPDRESIVKEFEWATTDMDKVLGDLSNRLQPLLRPDDRKEGSEPMPPVSPIRSQLHKIHAQAAYLRMILDRLEV